MVAEWSEYLVVRERHSDLFERVEGSPGLLVWPIMSERLNCSCCRSNGKWLMVIMSVFSFIGKTPCIPGGPCTRESPSAEVDNQQSSPDESDLLLESFYVTCFTLQHQFNLTERVSPLSLRVTRDT
jgi:hypothetical protein